MTALKFLTFTCLIIADQIIKFLAFKNLLPDAGGFLSGTCNPYIGWGIPLDGFLFWPVWLVSNLLLALLMIQSKYRLSLVIVLAGSISNIIDRILHGCVIDYLRLPVGNFPIFNLADVYITTGIIIFVLLELLFKKNSGLLKT